MSKDTSLLIQTDESTAIPHSSVSDDVTYRVIDKCEIGQFGFTLVCYHLRSEQPELPWLSVVCKLNVPLVILPAGKNYWEVLTPSLEDGDFCFFVSQAVGIQPEKVRLVFEN